MDGVLITDVELHHFGAPTRPVEPIINKNPAGLVWWGIQRYLDFDAAISSQDLNSLIWDELRAAGKNGMAGRKVKKGRSNYVCPKIKIFLDQA
ncbi:MAG: hypothetical protein JO076_09110 [Verrucomicrobia bacterium]|nr:hypothetical protein [Verrucomicrobiota bacterium]